MDYTKALKYCAPKRLEKENYIRVVLLKTRLEKAANIRKIKKF